MGYRCKPEEQAEARRLRVEGLTLAEIAANLGVSKSSVSLWVRHVEFVASRRGPSAPRSRGPNILERRKADEIERLLEEGRERIGRLSEKEFLVARAALYAGEGSKADGRVNLPNSDPRMVALFCSWLRHFFPIDEHGCVSGSTCMTGLTWRRPSRSGPLSPASLSSSSGSRIEPCRTPPSEGRSTRGGVRTSSTTARVRIVRSWDWLRRCYRARRFRGSSIGRAVAC
jgi:predicted transcriptional regulator